MVTLRIVLKKSFRHGQNTADLSRSEKGSKGRGLYYLTSTTYLSLIQVRAHLGSDRSRVLDGPSVQPKI